MRFKRPATAAILNVSVTLLFGGAVALAQAPMPTQQGVRDSSDQNRQMADQITELRGQVARLQAAVQQTGPSKKRGAKSAIKVAPQSKPMGMSDDKGEIGMSANGGMPMKDDEGEMGGMAPAGNAPSPGAAMGDDAVGGPPMGGKSSAPPAAAMGMGGGMGGAGGKSNMGAASAGGMATMNGSSSAMPGQAGTSHLYHIGSNGFFLNHSRHIALTPDQRLTLTHLKEKAMLDSSSEQRKIDQAEQELYAITGADQPDNTKIQAKVVEIEKVRADQRMNFIREVADASNVLTPEQRKVLLGAMAIK